MMEPSGINENAGFSSKGIRDSFRHAFTGIAILLRSERNARIHFVILVLVIAAGIILNISAVQWIAVALAAGLVIAAESFNTAIEILCDSVKPEYNNGIRKVKDLSAAGVLVSAIAAAAAGLFVFIPAILRIL